MIGIRCVKTCGSARGGLVRLQILVRRARAQGDERKNDDCVSELPGRFRNEVLRFSFHEGFNFLSSTKARALSQSRYLLAFLKAVRDKNIGAGPTYGEVFSPELAMLSMILRPQSARERDLWRFNIGGRFLPVLELGPILWKPGRERPEKIYLAATAHARERIEEPARAIFGDVPA